MEKSIFRMFPWVLLAALFYVIAVYATNPQIQTGFWKAGHITVGAYLGYWIDRHLFRQLNGTDNNRLVARAIVVAAAIIGMAFGL